jgi:hypothetical protein
MQSTVNDLDRLRASLDFSSLLIAGSAQAWNVPGHMITGAMA